MRRRGDERRDGYLPAREHRSARCARIFGLIVIVAALAFPATSLASLERVGVFGAGVVVQPEDLAVYDATSDLYEADGKGNRILKFDPEGSLVEGWGWGVGDGANKFERCGPEGEPAFPTCERGLEGEGTGEIEGAKGVAVDQATGDVFVYDGDPNARIQDFTANGEPIGSVARTGEAEGEVPKLNGGYGPGIAVNNKGDVYLISQKTPFGPRVMEFKPKVAGKYDEYEFAQSLFVGNRAQFAGQLAVDEAGDIYMAKSSGPVYKFDPSELSQPTCEDGEPLGIEGLAVNPGTGDIYFYEGKFHKVAVLGAKCEVLEHFESDTGAELEKTPAGAFSPSGVWQGRPKGILYLDTEETVNSPRYPAEIFAFAGSGSEQLSPAIEGSWTKSVGETFARLEAVVQPNGNDTRVKFEYGDEGPCSTAPCTEAPTGGLDIGSEAKPYTAGVTLASLAPGTTYYVRVVASSAAGKVDGPDETFHTFAAGPPVLPDGRAYELVTPAEKNGGEVFPLDPVAATCGCEPGRNNLLMPMESTESEGGESEVVYEGYPFADSGEAVDENEYRATRSAAGWHTEDLSPEVASREGQGGFNGFTPNLLTGVFKQREPVLSPDAIGDGYLDLYQRGANGAFTPLLTTKPPHRPAYGHGEEFYPEYVGQSPDGTRIFFTANDALTGATTVAPAAQDGGAMENNLYEWSGGELRLVNVLPGNVKTTPGAALGSGKDLGSTESGLDATNAISADGSRVFWSAEATGQVYVRIDGESTIEIPDSGRFLASSVDGEEVLLNDGEIYDLATKHKTDLTEGKGGFQGILGASDDLSHIYFVDTAALTLPSEKNAYGAAAKTGEDNLYFYSSETEEIRYIATLADTDNQTGEGKITGDWEASPTDRLAQVTANGEFLAFESHARLTGYNNEVHDGDCEDDSVAPLTECFEVFEYDAAADSLTCVSCNPTGIQPVGRSVLSLIFPIGSRFPQPRNLLPDGRLFFDSSDVLSPNDSEPGVENVYEYERAGQGACELNAGCVTLISSGHSGFGAQFFSATSSGRDAFFTTRAQLVSEDRDELVDLYDAREGGGLAVPEAPSPCTGEGCRDASGGGAEWTPPLSTLLATSPFTAPLASLEVKPATATPVSHLCPKHMDRRHGRCVRAKASDRKRPRHAREQSGGRHAEATKETRR